MKRIGKILIGMLILSFCISFNGNNVEASTLGKVTGLKKYDNTATTISIKWNATKSAKGYVVYRATSSKGKYSAIKTISSSSTTSYTNTGLTKNKTYYYKIRAFNTVNSKKVYGNYSSVLKATTLKSNSSVNSKAMKIYKNFMKNTSYIHPENYEEPAKTEKFLLLDINKDGIKELIITDKTAYIKYPGMFYGYDYAYVYTYRAGKLKYCGIAKGSNKSPLYIDGNNRLAYNWGGAGNIQYMYYGLNTSNGKLNETIFTQHIQAVDTFDKVTHDYDDNTYNNYNSKNKPVKISKKTFVAEEKIASKNTLLKVYLNTSSNRDKYFK